VLTNIPARDVQRDRAPWYDHNSVNFAQETSAMNSVSARPGSELEPMASIVPWKFSHLVIKTAQFPAMVSWYKAVLQAHVVQEGPSMCFLTYDGENHRLAIVNVPHLQPRPVDMVGVDHVSYTYRDLRELLSVYLRLKGLGILPRWTINHRITTSFYYQDPDGNRIELQVENFRSEEQLNRFFASDEYRRNTLGVRIDVEEWIRQYEGGASLESLANQPVPAFGSEALAILTEMGLAKARG
jgi:catechol 2,3-dioxygenase-like lactoylglutathione lyase family enzyme